MERRRFIKSIGFLPFLGTQAFAKRGEIENSLSSKRGNAFIHRKMDESISEIKDKYQLNTFEEISFVKFKEDMLAAYKNNEIQEFRNKYRRKPNVVFTGIHNARSFKGTMDEVVNIFGSEDQDSRNVFLSLYSKDEILNSRGFSRDFKAMICCS